MGSTPGWRPSPGSDQAALGYVGGVPLVRVNELDFYVEERGDGSPILLVPGTACPIPVWGNLPEELSKTHRVIAYERRGFNQTGGRSAGHQREHARDAAGLLRALNAVPAWVVGWSGGG